LTGTRTTHHQCGQINQDEMIWLVLSDDIAWWTLCLNVQMKDCYQSFFAAFILRKHCFALIIVCHLDGFDFIENHSRMSINAVLHTGSQFETQLCP